MILITLERRSVDCRVELDGKDITDRVVRIELDADVNSVRTVVRLTLHDDVSVAGDMGLLEFIKNKCKGRDA